jgi:hypothetical protein
VTTPPGLAGPFYRIFERCGHTPEDVRIGKPTPARTFVRNREIEKSRNREILDAARSDRSQPGQSLHRSWNIKASSPMVLRGKRSPTTANHDFKQQGCHANTERSSVCQPRALIGVGRTPPTRRARARTTPGLKAGARRAIRSRRPRQEPTTAENADPTHQGRSAGGGWRRPLCPSTVTSTALW